MAGKVLIADDSLRVQKELTELLEGAGVEVATVSNGEHAVRQLATVNPDLVLADIFMPVRTGYEVCEYIKTSSEFSHIAVLLLASKMEPYDEKEARRVAADGRIEKPFTDTADTLETIKGYLDEILATRPAPPIDEFAAAVPEAEAEPEPEPEPAPFATEPPAVDLDEQAAPMGFTEFVEEEEAPPAAALVEAEPETEAEESVDLSHATLLTTADELKQRMAELAPPSGAPSAEEEEELPPAAIVEPELAPAEAAPLPEPWSSEEAELPPAAVVEPEPEPAQVQAEGVDLSEATLLTTASELQQRMAEPAPPPQAPAEEEEALPSAEIIPTEQRLTGEAETVVEKPLLADAWEMTGPEPGAPEIPSGGGWDSQWKDSGEEVATEEEAAAEEAPAEEAPKPATAAYPPAEFAAAFGGVAGEEVAVPEETVPAEEPAEVAAEAYPEEVAEEDQVVAEETAQEIAHALEEPPLDPVLVEEVVNRVLERLSPERIESIARKVVHPLAEAILREKLKNQ